MTGGISSITFRQKTRNMYNRFYRKLVCLMFSLSVFSFQFLLFAYFFQTSYFLSVCLCLLYFSPSTRLTSVYLNADRFSSLTLYSIINGMEVLKKGNQSEVNKNFVGKKKERVKGTYRDRLTKGI